MIKLSLAKKFGIKLIGGDMVTANRVAGSAAMVGRAVAAHFNDVATEDYRSIESFATRLISDGIPTSIDGDVVIELSDGKGLVSLLSARNAAWHVWTTWRPSLEWLAQQAADNPVTYKDDTQHFGEDVQVGADPKVELIHKAWVDLSGKIDCYYQDWITLWHVAGGDYKNGEYFIAHDEVCHEKGAKYVCHNQEFNDYCEKMKAYTGDAPKVQSNKIKVTLNDADDISKGFTSRCVVMPVSIEPFQDGYSVGYKLPHESTVSPEPTKPIFTQAMADAGELPPVGAECNICYDSSEVFFKGSVIAYFEDLLWLNIDNRNPVRMISEVRFKPLDTRTEKQKSVDDFGSDIDDIWHGKTETELADELYTLGYRKLTPEQIKELGL